MKKVNKKSSSKNKKTIKKNNVNKHKIGLVMLLLVVALFTIGISYAFFVYDVIGNGTEVVTGQIYMRYSDNNTLLLNNIFPESKEKALKRTDNIIKFTINGKNTSNKEIYYGISLNYGDEILNKTRIKPEHIMIYLESEGQVLIDGIRYSDWDNERIWVEKILANTNSQTSKEYSLHIWVDEEVRISDSNPNADYKTDEWNNSYISLKLGVDGKLETMNMPLSIETNDTFVENNKSYFIAKVSNFYDMSDLGKTLGTNDNMKLEISSTNSDIVFSYKDSEGNEIEETNETLDLTYLFNKNKTVEVQVFVSSKIDASSVSDLNFKLTRNDEVVQNFYKRVTVRGNNFCLSNGFNKLYDCILASDSLANDVETAKVNIANKGEVNLNTTAPTYTYVENVIQNKQNAYTTDNYYRVAKQYEFNSDTGKYTLIDYIDVYLTDEYIGYYTIGASSSEPNPTKIYKIHEFESVNGKTTLTSADYYYSSVSSTIRSEVGLYKTEDDYGDVYFYRGDVTNNNVFFGGYYWKIIRTNGDNSIRMIYNGETANATGKNISINNQYYSYNDRTADPTYVGYMYGKKFSKQTSVETKYNHISASSVYYFADDYAFDEETEMFYLTGNFNDSTFSDLQDDYAKYPYTCGSTIKDDTCEFIIKVNGVINDITVKAQYISYSSVDAESVRDDTNDSDVKKQVDLWYETNILNKKDANNNLLTSYIVDGSFCNNRIFDSGDGYTLGKDTSYKSLTNLRSSVPAKPILKCSEIKDNFSHTNDRGNAKLEQPVALITADEVVLAGGFYNLSNPEFYLSVTGNHQHTMSPSSFAFGWAIARMANISSNGALIFNSSVTIPIITRPVINIKSDVLIASGDGTMENPFQLKLA